MRHLHGALYSDSVQQEVPILSSDCEMRQTAIVMLRVHVVSLELEGICSQIKYTLEEPQTLSCLCWNYFKQI